MLYTNNILRLTKLGKYLSNSKPGKNKKKQLLKQTDIDNFSL